LANSISVIVPTYNGAKKLPHILEALRQQTVKDFEIIIVVDGSTDHTKEILEKHSKYFTNLNILYQENGGRSISRNHGVATAKGEYLLFFDDDMRPVPFAISQHLAHIQAHPDTILVGAQVEEWEVLESDIQHYKGYLSRKWSGASYNPQTEGLQDPKQPYLTAAHFSISKTLFDKLGGFDELLTDSEDFDLAIKAIKANIPIYFRPDIIAWHDDFITCQSYIKRQREYTKSHQKLRQLYPERYQNYPQHSPNKPSFIKNIIYSFFGTRYWVRTIDGYNWLKYLPKSLRYRVYDWVITGLGIHFTERKI